MDEGSAQAFQQLETVAALGTALSHEEQMLHLLFRAHLYLCDGSVGGLHVAFVLLASPRACVWMRRAMFFALRLLLPPPTHPGAPLHLPAVQKPPTRT